MSSQLNSRSIGLIAVSLAWAAFLTIIGSPEVLLFTLPAFLLAAPLAFGRYVGDGLIDGFVRASRTAPKRARAVTHRFADVTESAGGSLLIALNLAGRAPPALAA